MDPPVQFQQRAAPQGSIVGGMGTQERPEGQRQRFNQLRGITTQRGADLVFESIVGGRHGRGGGLGRGWNGGGGSGCARGSGFAIPPVRIEKVVEGADDLAGPGGGLVEEMRRTS